MTLEIQRLGRIVYKDALQIMQDRVTQRMSGDATDAVFVLEHEPVLTLGRGAKRAHILASAPLLQARGVEIVETGRGGDVTYHGPGQLVGYAVLDLKPDRCDVRRFVTDLEEVMAQVVRSYGIQGVGRVPGLNGIWIDGSRKIGAVGVRISRWVTSHGCALNINTDLSAFDWIIPCGIKDRTVTSVARELGREVDLPQAYDRMERAFQEILGQGALELDSESVG